ncbi:MAG: hypothetical protein ACTSSH_06545 [Candidatus Heimdallarchaeota archaeon]
MSKIKIRLVMGFSFLTLLFVGVTFVKAPVVAILSSNSSPDPVIDGTIGVSEWNESISKTVTLYQRYNESLTKTLDIMSVYGTGDHLYFALVIPDTTLSVNDRIYLIFKESKGKPLVVSHFNGSSCFGDNNDLKYIDLGKNTTRDGYTVDAYDNPGMGLDPVRGGTHDTLACKTLHNGTHYTSEVKYAFDSGDTKGCDFNVTVGDQVDIFLAYLGPNLIDYYWQVRETTGDYEWIELQIGPQTAANSIPIISIFSGMTVIAIGTFIVKKRK